jgi:RNA polymerase sigma factor (sigma-70 family)
MSAPDRATLDALVGRSYQSLHRFVTRKISNHASAEDVLQDALCDAFKGLHNYRGDAELISWVFGIVANKVRRYYRKEYDSNTDIVGDEVLDNVASEACGPSDRLEETQQLRQLAALMDDLPPDMRLALWQVAVDGASYEAVANGLGMPIGTLRSRLSRARARIREGLELDVPI